MESTTNVFVALQSAKNRVSRFSTSNNRFGRSTRLRTPSIAQAEALKTTHTSSQWRCRLDHDAWTGRTMNDMLKITYTTRAADDAARALSLPGDGPMVIAHDHPLALCAYMYVFPILGKFCMISTHEVLPSFIAPRPHGLHLCARARVDLACMHSNRSPYSKTSYFYLGIWSMEPGMAEGATVGRGSCRGFKFFSRPAAPPPVEFCSFTLFYIVDLYYVVVPCITVLCRISP